MLRTLGQIVTDSKTLAMMYEKDVVLKRPVQVLTAYIQELAMHIEKLKEEIEEMKRK